MATDTDATTEPTTDRDAEAFAERVYGVAVDSLTLYGLYIGDRLGLFRALADAGSAGAESEAGERGDEGGARDEREAGSDGIAPGELAAATGTDERYVREWCEAMTVWGVLTVEDRGAPAAERRYALPRAYVGPLVDEESLEFVGALPQLVVGAAAPVAAVLDAFRTGAGVPYAAYGRDLHEGQGRINRPAFVHDLPGEWLTAMADVDERLREPGARVLDVGCGYGWSSVAVADAYPDCEVLGVDLDESSVEAAREHVAAAGLADRVALRVGDAATVAPEAAAADGPFDLPLALECVHDMSDPVGVLAGVREGLADDGVLLVADERVGEAFEEPSDVEEMMYGWSVLHCLPVGRSAAPAVGTGTVMRPGTLREYAREAGFERVEVLPVEHLFLRLYRLEPA
jgi:predicted O-methyltransferase YrrM